MGLHTLVLTAWEMTETGRIWRQCVNEADTLNTVCQCPTLKQPRQISLIFFRATLLTPYHLVKNINSVLMVAFSAVVNSRAVWNWPQNMYWFIQRERKSVFVFWFFRVFFLCVCVSMPHNPKVSRELFLFH